jgi:hypothetical protein
MNYIFSIGHSAAYSLYLVRCPLEDLPKHIRAVHFMHPDATVDVFALAGEKLTNVPGVHLQLLERNPPTRYVDHAVGSLRSKWIAMNYDQITSDMVLINEKLHELRARVTSKTPARGEGQDSDFSKAE